ncbi:hypothetical protein HQQ80_16320 [Microbacteriaceae bacterium VKM Ac-2855]|nr:hypothetical protein [Microbacteriaceae bacterium VKM Ac-2855]
METTRTTPDPPRIGLIARPWRVIWFVVIVALVAGGALWLGGTVTSPEQVAIDAGDERIPIDVAVESRVVGETTTLQGAVRAGLSIDVEAIRPADASRAVVEQVLSPVGTTVSARSVLAVVSARPMIVLPLAIPLYRDLATGDEGADVIRLQTALAKAGFEVTDTGVVDGETQEAIRDLYDEAGFDPPGGFGVKTTIDLQELVQIPGDTAVVTDIVDAGSILGGTAAVSSHGSSTAPMSAPGTDTGSDPTSTGAPSADDSTPRAPGSSTGEVLATLQVRPNTILARSNVLQVDALPVGGSVTVRGSDGIDIAATVAEIGEFTADTTTGGGYDITLTIPDEHQAALTVGQSVTVTAAAGGGAVAAVPIVAIRQEAGEAWVQPFAADGETPPPPVKIAITEQADGWAAIVETAALPVGTRLEVGP